MAEIVIAAGSNLGNRQQLIRGAGRFLEKISEQSIEKSSIWESEPIGPAEYPFLNSIAIIETSLKPVELLTELKKFEQASGRSPTSVRWGPRLLDLDIIAWDNLVIQEENLIIPHPEYKNRLFVLLPLQELRPYWTDPEDGNGIESMITEAPQMRIYKTSEDW
ncbi:MAG: 2-amino-4-hydroxy-6-hydroxymethyldihydropteridine diphosphokinase [Balneolaceae bacterium]